MNTFLTSLGRHDVLLGRGTGPNEHEGNKTFRRMSYDLALRAHAVKSTKPKREFAAKLVDMVHANHGKFVRKLTKAEVMEVKNRLPFNRVQDLKSVSPSVDKNQFPEMYVVVPKSVAVLKANQSFRHQFRLFLMKDEPTSSPPSELQEAESAGKSGNGDDMSKRSAVSPVPSSKEAVYPLRETSFKCEPAVVDLSTLVNVSSASFTKRFHFADDLANIALTKDGAFALSNYPLRATARRDLTPLSQHITEYAKLSAPYLLPSDMATAGSSHLDTVRAADFASRRIHARITKLLSNQNAFPPF